MRQSAGKRREKKARGTDWIVGNPKLVALLLEKTHLRSKLYYTAKMGHQRADVMQ